MLAALERVGQEHGATLFMVLLAGFQSLLARYSGQEAFCVGSPVAGRNRPELEGLIGFFVNTLAMRADLSGNPTFAELLARTRETALAALAHQDVPFDRLVQHLLPQRDLSRSPLFQVVFSLQNAPMPEVNLPELSLSGLDTQSGTAKFDLTLTMMPVDNRLSGSLEYSTDLFSPATADQMVAHYLVILKALVADLGQRVFNVALGPAVTAPAEAAGSAPTGEPDEFDFGSAP